MAYALRPGQRLQHEVRRVASERLGGAIDHLDTVLDADRSGGPDVDIEQVVHEVRKRCKASRGLVRLAKPALGDDFSMFDLAVRDAASQLSKLRDSHAALETFDALLVSRPDDDVLLSMRERQALRSFDASGGSAAAGDDRIATARQLLAEALAVSQRWKIPRGFDVIEAGVAATYRQGRSALRRVRADPTDHRVHEWRKSVKYLWYQMQLLHDAAPSVLGPLVEELDRLGGMLGDDHDLSVLIELVRDDHAGSDALHVGELARTQQQALRAHAMRSGSTIYAEPDHAFAHRIERYWRLAVELGPEPTAAVEPAEAPVRSLIERERRFLVDAAPPHDHGPEAVALRQGYLATGEQRSIRVRDAGSDGCTLTFKAGAGAERTELEWSIEQREFDAAWPHTDGRRIEKTRRRIVFGRHVIELDVFGGELEGLVIAEVEFSSADALAAFEPPAWFGREVTDDGRYSNASLALHGHPDAGVPAETPT